MLKIFEENLQRVMQDKTFLQLSSMHLNGALWWQKKIKELSGQTTEIEALKENLYLLEKKCHQHEEDMEELKSELQKLREKKSARKKTTRTAKKTSAEIRPV